MAHDDTGHKKFTLVWWRLAPVPIQMQAMHVFKRNVTDGQYGLTILEYRKGSYRAFAPLLVIIGPATCVRICANGWYDYVPDQAADSASLPHGMSADQKS
jgi:hypothetical protein